MTAILPGTDAPSALKANAFALPSGIVVLTDELEALAQHDDELSAVFAHEIGHVVHRHSMRMVIQHSASALLMLGLLGDVNSATSVVAAGCGRYLRRGRRSPRRCGASESA